MKDNKETTEQAIQEVAKIVTEMAGIQLGPRQLPMVENRLKTRMLRLELQDFGAYLKYLKAHREAESQALVSLMTTHHTFFFREFAQFEFLLNRGLDRLIEMARKRADKTIRILSAACSKGHEVYSLAMFFDFHLKAVAPDLKFEIWGTDIDPESVKHGKNGVYKVDELKQSPAMYLANHWIRGKGNVKDYSKVREELKSHCHFATANLLNYDSFIQGRNFDLIFCRNVFIYFNADQIKQISEKLIRALDEGGFLFVGVSETLSRLQLPVESIGPSIYQKPGAKVKAELKKLPQEPIKPKIAEVLCIDDSKTIHSLLDRILIGEHGFKITSRAMNGREALEILKTKKFDFITLDLHMPELDGIGFLNAYQDRSAPIIVISSINRDDTSIAQKALTLGACDYVEKPSLENMAQAGNEIRAKMKFVLNQKRAPAPTSSQKGVAVKASKPHVEAIKVKTETPVRPAKKTDERIKVLIVDDSKTIRVLLKNIVAHDKRFQVVGEAEKPSEVEALIKKNRPDVITMDIHMPEMTGVELLKKLNPIYKIPTVMISSISKEEGSEVFEALAAGAVDYIQKPSSNKLGDLAKEICDKLAAVSRARIQIRKAKTRKALSSQKADLENLVIIGSSTGGTEALRVLFESLPSNIPPVLVVQHIPPVFSAAFAERLNHLLPFEVKEAVDGDEVKTNRVLLAPGGKQMAFHVKGKKTFIKITDAPPVNRHKPSVDYLFESVAEAQLKKVIAVILTGMGADGARMMKRLRDQGARTIAQDETTCVVYGMPREAVEIGAAEFVLPLEGIGQKIMNICEGKK